MSLRPSPRVSMRSSTPFVQNMKELCGPPLQQAARHSEDWVHPATVTSIQGRSCEPMVRLAIHHTPIKTSLSCMLRAKCRPCAEKVWGLASQALTLTPGGWCSQLCFQSSLPVPLQPSQPQRPRLCASAACTVFCSLCLQLRCHKSTNISMRFEKGSHLYGEHSTDYSAAWGIAGHFLRLAQWFHQMIEGD